jgi:SNF2 family DNA or RNA helicase
VVRGESDADVRCLIVNVDAFSTETAGAKLAEEMLARRDCLLALDESTKVKNPTAKRTRSLTRIARRATYRRILTGTPVTQSPVDVYSQFRLLDPILLGHSSYYSFRDRYCLMGGHNGKEILGYVNLGELQERTAAHSFRVVRSEVLDLPPKTYQRVPVDLSDEQRRLYKSMRDTLRAELDGEEITAAVILAKMVRLQQIAGGFFPLPPEPTDDGTRLIDVPPRLIPGSIPRVEACLDLCEGAPGKTVVWFKFRPEIAHLSALLRKQHGEDAVVEFHGGVADADRDANRRRFQDPGDPARFFLGQAATGGFGLTLTAADTCIYYSHTFSLEERLQSEDRLHRGGQTRSVVYYDLVARGTLDLRVHAALREKRKLASIITRDNYGEWL